jgi:hypothetical protein
MKQRNQIITALLLSGLSVHAFASLQATLDRDQIGQGETVQLNLQHDGGGGDPDLSPLKQDFNIVGTSQGSSIQIANGQMSRQAQVQVILAPKHAGKITLPPLQWGNDRSPILVLNVTNAAGNSASSNSNNVNSSTTSVPPQNSRTATAPDNTHVFIESTVNQKQPYVQGGVILTIRIYTDVQVDQAGLDFQANNDVLVQQLGKDTQSSETRNGHFYQVVQRQYLLTPQRSGQLSLNGPVFNAQVADLSSLNSVFGNDPFAGMVTASRPISVQGKAILLNVRPRPVDATGHDLLPAEQLTVQESWQPIKSSVATGEPLTRHIHIVATGLAGNSLPDLSTLMSLPDGIKAYPDQAKYTTNIQDGKVVGNSDQDIALIANRPGHYDLPAVKLSWWDTTHNAQREITLPARSIDVTGSAISANATSPQANSNSNSTNPNNINATTKISTFPWLWISLALFGLWIITLLAWWWDHRKLKRHIGLVVNDSTNDSTNGSIQDSALQKSKPKKLNDRAKEAKAFQQACYANDAIAARLHLLAWATAAWPKNPPSGISGLAQQLADPNLTSLLEQLDRACYGSVEWHGESLALALTTLPTMTKTKKANLGLDRLYPD